MKAAVWYGRKDVRIEEVPEPQVKPGCVKIKISWCGICGSDLHEYVSGPVAIPVEKPPRNYQLDFIRHIGTLQYMKRKKN